MIVILITLFVALMETIQAITRVRQLLLPLVTESRGKQIACEIMAVPKFTVPRGTRIMHYNISLIFKNTSTLKNSLLNITPVINYCCIYKIP